MAKNDWLPVSGGISWDRFDGDDFMITFVFNEKDDFREFKKYLKKINKSNIVISVVEHQKKYSVLFFEDPKENIFPKLTFVWPVLMLGARYESFRDSYDNSKMRFAYAENFKSVEDGTQLVSIDPIISPFKIKQFNIIKESELDLDQSNSEVITTNDFKYAAETVLIGLIKRKFKQDN